MEIDDFVVTIANLFDIYINPRPGGDIAAMVSSPDVAILNATELACSFLVY